MQEGDTICWSGVNGEVRGVIVKVLEDGTGVIAETADGKVVLVARESIGLPL